MKRIEVAFWSLLALLTALWLAADSFVPAQRTFIAVRDVFVQYTGVLAVGAMSVAMVLATRPKWLEPRLDGLDKMYRLHKWLGIAALVFSAAHWLWAQGPKWLVGLGLMQRPERPRRGDAALLDPVQQLLRNQRGLAESLGEWAFYIAAVLIALALIKRIPYHWFVKVHKWIAPIYLVLVFHAVVLVKFGYWAQPVGIVLALLLVAGTVSAFMSIFRLIGAGRRARGVVERLIYYPELRVLEKIVRLHQPWRGHEAGQFAYLTSNPREGPHPYTIASAWKNDGQIVFITKALGDHTSLVHERLKAGDPVEVEGPYGCFTFADRHPRQIWVGGGIGITPFIARMKELARDRGEQIIDLFHTTANYEQKAIDKLRADAKAAGVRLHVLVDSRDGRLDAQRIRRAVPDWASASLWFCGPPGFGQSLRRDFLRAGMAPADFHQELFAMR